jgi:hypothetical protein
VTGNLTSADPFDSLDAMKARHKELLRTSEKEITVATVRERVCEFLARGTATGLVLDDPGERRVAQGLIDYWKATLYTQLRGEAEPAAPCPTTTVLADFPEDDSAKLVAAAEVAVSALAPEDRDVARRILQLLVRLEPAVREFHPVPVSRVTLDELGNVGQVVRVIHALEKAGVIRSALAPTGEARVELTAAHLVRTWPRYADWLKDRLAFRTAAYLWQQRERHSSGLVAGPPLAAAAGYRDLDALEGEFLSASRGSAERTRKVRQWSIFAILFLFIVGLAGATFLERARRKSEKLRADEAVQSSEALKAFTEMEKVWERQRHEKELLEQQVKAERVVNINRMIRSLSDVVAASGDYGTLARWRWEELDRELRRDPVLKVFLAGHDEKLKKLLTAKTPRERGPVALEIARGIRNRSLAVGDREVISSMEAVREESYRAVERVVGALEQAARTGKTFDEVRAFRGEFWRFYWGALAMVEGPEVEGAMVGFGKALDTWEQEWEETKKPPSAEVVRRLTDARRRLSDVFRADLGQPIRPHTAGALPRK